MTEVNPVNTIGRGQGLTLLEALERYSDTAAYQEFQAVAEHYGKQRLLWLGDSIPEENLLPLRAQGRRLVLERALVNRLAEGTIVGTAYSEPLNIDSRRMLVPADRWKFLVVDFDKATASGHGLVLIDVRIHPGGPSRGRKTERVEQTDSIHGAFSQLLEVGGIRFDRGGLTAAAEELSHRFPSYKPDSIRKIIQHAFNEAKRGRPKKDKE